MLSPCEVAVKIVLPVVRAMVANTLVNERNLNQADAAKLLGVSQPSVSLYQQKLRGNAINLKDDEEVLSLVTKYADLLANGSPGQSEKLGSFCEICRTICSKGYLCSIHKSFDPAFDVEACNFCRTSLCNYNPAKNVPEPRL